MLKGGLLVKALAGLFGPPPCYHTFNFIAHCTKSSKGNKLYLDAVCFFGLIQGIRAFLIDRVLRLGGIMRRLVVSPRVFTEWHVMTLYRRHAANFLVAWSSSWILLLALTAGYPLPSTTIHWEKCEHPTPHIERTPTLGSSHYISGREWDTRTRWSDAFASASQWSHCADNT